MEYRKESSNVNMIQGSEYPQSETDSVMTRSLDGIINFWNRAAEELYGWKKEEAVGRVSHELLKTHFPKPLEEIDSELVTKGRWEGRLVHSTRNGEHVVVESRWIFDSTRQPGAVVEINSPCEASEANPRLGSTTSTRSKWANRFLSMSGSTSRRINNARRKLTYIGLISLALGWILYFLIAHPLIDETYQGRAAIPFLNQVMEGRAVTPVESYHQAADRLMLLGTIWLIGSYFLCCF